MRYVKQSVVFVVVICCCCKENAKNLKLYWEFLQDEGLDWKTIKLDQLAEFIHWLRNPNPGIYPITPTEATRTNRTINQILSTISSFDEFHARLGNFSGVELTTNKVAYPSQYKPFLYGIANQSQVRKRLLKVKEPKRFPKCLTSIQVQQLIKACNTLRDKFLICLLYETGLRIGEALGLRHEDMLTEGRNEIFVRFRENINGARAKSRVERLLAVNIDLMRLYSNYLIDEYPVEADCDYVFVNIKSGQIGEPMKVSRAKALFQDLSDKTGIHVSPHLLRHTLATRMVNEGVPLTVIQKYLGHKSPDMTMTYAHIHDQTMRACIDKFHGKVVNISGETVVVNSSLDHNQDLQWMRRNILAQALPNGSCARPMIKGACPHANACLTCNDFRTTIEFLSQHKEQHKHCTEMIDKAKLNGWQRQVEMNEQILQSLEKIIDSLEKSDE
ncbi:tyrosine-type recombinase/integrase [Scytonema sp. UIC 10036]|nr:tyrosine-type recombinase/integrase [Scytonema sp. UIC 10036]